MKKYYSYFLLFLMALSACGCFDIRRDIKIYPNGYGIENVYITLDRDFFDKFEKYASLDQSGNAKQKLDTLRNNVLLENGLRADIQRTPGTSLKDLVITDKDDGSKEIYFQYTFDDPAAIVKIIYETTFSFSNKLNVKFSTLKFTLEDNDLKFRYVLRNASRSFDDELALSIFGSTLGSKRVSHSIEFPFEITASNSTAKSYRTLSWESSMYDIEYNQVEMTAEMTKDEGLELPYAERIDKTVGKVSQKNNPLIRVQIYNANQEPVKIGTGIILKDNILVTNFKLMNLLDGGGFFSVIMNNDSLTGVDEMNERDLDPKQDLVFLRFANFEKVKMLKYALVENISYGQKAKVFYYPNPLSSVVYSMDATITGIKKWTKKTSVVEVKPSRPLGIEGGAVFNEAGEFIGMVTREYNGEVGKIYVIPGVYIKTKIPPLK